MAETVAMTSLRKAEPLSLWPTRNTRMPLFRLTAEGRLWDATSIKASSSRR